MAENGRACIFTLQCRLCSLVNDLLGISNFVNVSQSLCIADSCSNFFSNDSSGKVLCRMRALIVAGKA